MPHFQPGYTLRVSGDVRLLDADEFAEPGFHITDDCIACGACASACTHKAIVPGEPYSILGERCDECGNCHHVCPTGAVVEKGL